MKAYLIRNFEGNIQTLGTMVVFDDFTKVYECKTLELPWKENKRNISCIPKGSYIVRKRKAEESPSRAYDHFMVQDVPNRSYILWHAGNYNTDIKGCILMGQYYLDLNKDGQLDVVKTKYTIDLLYRILPDEFEFTII